MIQITLSPKEGFQTKSVIAVGVGCFAIHKDGILSKEFCPVFWKVTHIQTGLLVGWFFSGMYAKHYAEWLMTLPVDWQNIKTQEEGDNVPVDIRLECARMVHSEPVPFSWKATK